MPCTKPSRDVKIIQWDGPVIEAWHRVGGRRLSDKIRAAIHTACDLGEVEIADDLLARLAALIKDPPVLPAGVDRRQPESLTAVRERLANLVLWRIAAGWAR